MKVLVNRLQIMDKQVKELYVLDQPNNKKHIKGKQHSSDLTESIHFMTKKYNDYRKDRAEKEKLIKDLREEVSTLKNEHGQLKSDVENQEQYTRRYCLLDLSIPKEQRKAQIDLF